ncbi:MAG: preprotein translocase subunit SecG [Candidatus Margulisiibacteriota bacterium]
MKLLLLGLQLISGLSLIILVLLHSAKGEGLGGIGGSAHMFGSQQGLEKGLDRLTMVAAVTFVTVSLILTITAG